MGPVAQSLRNAPLAWTGVAMILGLVLQEAWPGAWAAALLILLLPLLLIGGLRARAPPSSWKCAILLGVIASAMAHSSVQRSHLEGTVEALSRAPPGTVRSWAGWISESTVGADGVRTLRVEVPEAPGVAGTVRLRVVEFGSGTSSPGPRRDPFPLGLGDPVTVTGTYRPPAAPRNPGQPDPRLAARVRGEHGTISAREVARAPPRAVPWSLRRCRARLRGWMAGRLQACLRGRARSFALAATLNVRAAGADRLAENMQRTGTSHILAISGLHVALVAPVFWLAAYGAGRRRSGLTLAVVAGVWAYVLLAGAPPSAVRCAWGVTIYGAAHFAGRSRNAWNALGAAAVGTLVVDPAALFDAGFQLSYSAVAGMLALSRPVERALAGGAGVSRAPFVTRAVRSSLAVSLAAWLGSLPVAVVRFHRLTPVVLVANVLAFPLAWLALLLSLAALALACIHPLVAWPIARLLDALLWAFDLLLDALADLPGSCTFLPDRAAWQVAAFLAGISAWAVALRRWPRPAAWAFPVAALAVLCWPARPAPPGPGEVWVLDAGRGAVAVVRGPDGGVIVYDDGSLSSPDAGSRILAPCLWALGVDHVEAIVLSHPHADHVNGVPSALEILRPHAVFVAPGFDRDPVGRRILTACAARGVRVVEVASARAPPAAAWAEWIPPPCWPAMGLRSAAPNDESLGMRVRVAGRTILFLGDAEEREVCAWLDGGRLSRADVLVAPHHGKFLHSYAELASAVEPRAVLVSAPKGYSSDRVLAEWRRGGAAVWQTGRWGALRVRAGLPAGEVDARR